METDSHDNSNISVEETGFDRVKKMYSKDIHGLISPEMHYMATIVSTSTILTAATGAFVHMMRAKDNYLRQNTATPFESEYLARRHLLDNMTLQGMKGAVKFALKYGSFSSLYTLSTMTLTNYHNKVCVSDHIGTGVVMGALYRFNFGLKGMLAAGCVGGFLGMVTGSIFAAYMWYFNLTPDDLRELQHQSYYEWKRTHHNV